MKTKSLLLVTVLLLVHTSFSSCVKKEDPIVLPPETQTGENTFGCYVNGELFVAEIGYPKLLFGGRDFVEADYDATSRVLTVFGAGRKGNCELWVGNPEENIKKIPLRVRYYEKDITFLKKDTGEVFLTRFDTINKIVSGTFACEIPLYENFYNKPLTDSVVRITQGRFDIIMDIF